MTRLLGLDSILDEEIIGKIRKAAQGDPPYTFSYQNALGLLGLKGKLPDLPKAVHETWEIIHQRRLLTAQTMALVDHVASGKESQDFDPTKVKRKNPKSPLGSEAPNSEQEIDSEDPKTVTEEDTETEEEETPKLNPFATL